MELGQRTRTTVGASSTTLDAVHEVDLADVLDRLALTDEERAGRLLCPFCNEPVDRHSIGALAAYEDQVVAVHRAPDCIAALARRLDENRVEES